MDNIQNQIIEKLNHIEIEHNIKIPIAVESGSRAWGFASPNSDYDCRFVYVHPQEFYLSVFEQKDTIEYIPDTIFDLSGWDLRKFITHLVKSNVVMLEWLKSNIIYCKEDEIYNMLWELGGDFFNPISASWQYLSTAKNKLEELDRNGPNKIKKYFYILRPLACVRFIREQGSIPFMEYEKNVKVIDTPKEVRDEIANLIAIKKEANEGDFLQLHKMMFDYFDEEVTLAEKWLVDAKYNKEKNYTKVDQYFRKIIEEANKGG